MWQRETSVRYRLAPPTGTRLVAAFDFDSTLIFSDRGEKYANKGWVPAYANTLEYLRLLHADGWNLVIFSNRKGSPVMIAQAQRRADAFSKVLGVPISFFYATALGQYRKPHTGMWDLYRREFNLMAADPNSFYCGDAAGPTAEFELHRWGDDDRQFAANIGLRFFEPHQIFQAFAFPILAPTTRLVIVTGLYTAFQLGMQFELDTGHTLTCVASTDIASCDDIRLVTGPYTTGEGCLAVAARMGVPPEHVVVLWDARTATPNTDFVNQFKMSTLQRIG